MLKISNFLTVLKNLNNTSIASLVKMLLNLAPNIIFSIQDTSQNFTPPYPYLFTIAGL